jgi:hypothetical protein
MNPQRSYVFEIYLFVIVVLVALLFISGCGGNFKQSANANLSHPA